MSVGIQVTDHGTSCAAPPLTLTPVPRLAFCASCCREQRHRGEPVHIRAEWTLAWLTHCPRHRAWLLNDCVACLRSGVFDFTAARSDRLACRFCGASIEMSITSPPSPMLEDVFHLQRTLLASARGAAVEPSWVGPCSPHRFVRAVRDLMVLLGSVGADGRTMLAEYLPVIGWEGPRLRRGHRQWVGCSVGERLSLMNTLVAVLRLLDRRPRKGHPPHDPLRPLWAAMSTTQHDVLRHQVRDWPASLRRRMRDVTG